MRRFLIVGCGGSGGLTLQFLMDQLHADLQARGITELPRGWQFLHIDVPIAPDGVGGSRPPSVRDQGGEYLSIGTMTGQFRDVADGIVRRLQAGPGLGGLTTWSPHPKSVGVPVSEGAGQFRAVGRILALAKVQEIRERLETAWRDIDTGAARAETKAAAKVLSPATVDAVDQAPYVLVVSSMAGGTGAAMVIDVCRILASIGPNPEMIAVVVHTAQVFDGLAENQRAGVDANAAAMIGELMALQAGAGVADDRGLLRDLGAALPGEAAVPFRRVIPVGSRIGTTGERMGDSADDRCRGLGRAIAALMADGTAWEGFKKNTLENFGGGRKVDQSIVGWGVDSDNLVWGSLGYASVSLGRERYFEYSAQRLAREAVDRLVVGHLTHGDDRPASAQLDALLDQTLWPRLAAAIRLPEQRTQVGGWLDGVSGNRFRPVSIELAEEARTMLPAGQRQLAELGRLLVAGAREQEPRWRDRLAQEAYVFTAQWVQWVQDTLSAQVRDVTAEFGLPAAQALLQHWQERCEILTTWLREGAVTERQPTLAQPGAALQHVQTRRGQARADSAFVTELVQGLAVTIHRQLAAELGGLLAQVLPDLREGWTQQLIDALNERLRELELLRADSSRHAGQAQARTDVYASWPGPGIVPERFNGAPNEVQLTTAEEFRGLFDRHVRATGGGDLSSADALRQVIGTVLHGRWQTTGGNQVDSTCVEVLAGWRSQALARDVAADGTIAARINPPAPGGFRITLDAPEVLRRAREYLDRPKEPFSRFVRVSLDEYLVEPGLREAERARRSAEVVRAVTAALGKAQPMVAVDALKARWIHGQDLQVYYTFSAMPVGDTPVSTELLRHLDAQVDVMQPQTREALQAAVTAGVGSRATRIDIYGSYPNLSPVVFTSLLEPVIRRWDQCTGDAERATFWRWKRSRRLAGALPVGDAARQAMITGWFVGRMFGLVRYPEESGAGGFFVYDVETGNWVQLPSPMPAPGGRPGSGGQPDRGLDRLAAVLEAMPVRLANCATAPAIDPLEPLKGYRVLRQLGDDGPAEPSGISRVATRAADVWIDTGTSLSDLEPGRSGPAGGTPGDRRTAILDYLDELTEHFTTEYLPPNGYRQTPSGRFSRIDDLQEALETPRFHEVAADALVAVDTVRSLVRGDSRHIGGPDV